jgi:hypothetical protein
MKASPLLRTGKAIVLVCFTLFVVLPVLVGLFWSVQNWSYTRFCWRGQSYYARVGDACDQLLAAAEPFPRKLKGDNLKSLPPTLRQLNIDHMVVDTNTVMMMVGSGLMSRQILWKPTEDGSCWELITSNPEARSSRVVYTRAKTANHSMQRRRASRSCQSQSHGPWRLARTADADRWVLTRS